MLERLIIAGALVALLLAVIAAGRRWYAWRNERIERRLRDRAEAQRADTQTGSGSSRAPRIVYFTTQTCVICKAQQEPAIAALLNRRTDVLVERHDAVDERDLADEYGVLSVPTTAVYDASGRLVTVNRGFAPAALLLAQVSGNEPAFEGGTAMPSEPLR
ncbi:MAG: thioredoxin family protein [Chloroflexi bacterium]|nr:thioredoxin family protein [Chloroflexota bacterium]